MSWSTTAPSNVSWSTEKTSQPNTANNYNNFRVVAAVARGVNDTIYVRAKIQLYGKTYGQDGNTKIRAEVNIDNETWVKSSTYDLQGEYGGWLTKKTVYYTGTAEPGDRIEVRTAWSTSNYSGQVSFSAPAYNSTYTITFDGNGADGGATAAQTITYGAETPLTANGFTRQGYAFTEWNTQADGLGTSYADGADISLTGNMTLYAQWARTNIPVFVNVGGTIHQVDQAYANVGGVIKECQVYANVGGVIKAII